MAQRPGSTLGLRHIALYVPDLGACERFYVELLGMRVEWRPDPDNLYLSSGHDNLALHRATTPISGQQRLDHIGIIIETPQAVDAWYTFLNAQSVPMRSVPKTHRDGARSFYCEAPDGTVIQMIYHPPLAGNRNKS
ncbi:MAG: VOC family protein [Gammaproteobacteria bacterium]|nr:VOC family protein [Gammaproteobacteria bacterium]